MAEDKKKDSIAVVMSTYNGERFLREQIDSIRTQENVSLDLFIRDDGSRDHTGEIIREYDDRFENVHIDFGKNMGVGNSFMEALYSTPGSFDYYAFSDQDDIWEPNKCAEGINKLKASGKALYASNQECIDADGKSMGMRYEPEKHIHLEPIEILFRNMIAGCTFIYTADFAETLKKKPFSRDLLNLRIHDVVVAAAASVYGGIYYDENSYIKYRQHENNVVGVKETTKLDDLKSKANKAMDRSKRNGRSRLAREICERYPEKADKIELLKVCAYPQKRENKRILIRNRDELCSYADETKLGFVMKVLTGLF